MGRQAGGAEKVRCVRHRVPPSPVFTAGSPGGGGTLPPAAGGAGRCGFL